MTEKRKVRIGPLTTVGQVAGELGRLYRQARRGLPVADASRLATILAAMRTCLEASELERRIADMEAALAPANATSSVVQLRLRR
jgi:cell division protein ZapA (FtsZ GTPase activity inhibitor)